MTALVAAATVTLSGPSFAERLPAAVPTLVLPAMDREALLAQDRLAPRWKPLRIADSVPVSLRPPSHIGPDDQGQFRWRQRVEVPGATDLSFGFAGVRLPPGVALWIYDDSRQVVRGPYTEADNRAHRELWTPVVPGSVAVIELALAPSRPVTGQVPQSMPLPQLELVMVNAGYRDLFAREPTGMRRQGDCHIDVACPQADAWRDELRSVARYTIVDDGVYLCSGQLVADVPGSLTPYFLTADHCGATDANDQTMVFYWNFESPVCGELGGGSLSQAQSGAIWRAGRQDIDFSLVELEATPLPAWNVFHSGWDRRPVDPAVTVGIHHPGGDEKAISLNTSGGVTAQDLCIAGTGSPDGFYWLDWEQGVTEQGSSGSGLWRADSRGLIGYLSGGSSECTGTIPNSAPDCYGRLAGAWHGSQASGRLRDWLDPGNTGATSIAGVDPNAGICGDGVLDAGEQCDDAATLAGDGCSETCQVESGFECTAPVAAPGIADGSFEAGTPNPHWQEFSVEFDSPICSGARCGAGLASDGNWFGWFGRIAGGDVGVLEQPVLIPPDATTLSLNVIIPNCDSDDDALRISLDGTEVLVIDGSSPLCGSFAYTQQSADISAFADGRVHWLRIEGQTHARHGEATRIFFDELHIDGEMTGAGVASQCHPAPQLCQAHDFSTALAGFTSFTSGPNAAQWGTSDDGLCHSGAVLAAGNVTGGDGIAACIDSSASGSGLIDAYLCSPPFDLSETLTPVLEFAYNYQIDGAVGAEDLFQVLAGTVAPGEESIAAYEVVFERSIDAGAEFDLPGFDAAIDVSALSGSTAWFCFRYRADDDLYAQVDDIRVVASRCAAPSDSDGDGIADDADNCLATVNFAQLDTDGDSIGNACDPDIAPALNDCAINFLDLEAVKTAFFATPAAPNWNADADFTGDGQVNFADLGVIRAAFFGSPGPSGLPNDCD